MNIYEAGPGRKLIAISPSDSTVLEEGVRALWVGTGGSVSILCPGERSAVTIANIPDGTLLPIRAAKVMAATDASDIVGII